MHPGATPSSDDANLASRPGPAARQLRVMVTGAGGRTGSLILDKLLRDPQFEAFGVVRSETARAKAAATGIRPEALIPVDVAGPDADRRLADVFRGMDAVILATSSVPRLLPFSLVGVVWKKLTQVA